eukprot:TRINITY_DN32872_c0_g1_i1.p1 TRINITY_DN32872_c0_g1~~TRINITY_DN32872_c0_g1_i1.p1  ORF type:complete len:106 (-),score=27.09 TRINITY_DN32872_c0_g1_i1:63-380(-)
MQWPVVRMRIKDVIEQGEQGYGAAKRRRNLLQKARHQLALEKGVQNALVREKTWLVNRKAELVGTLAELPQMEDVNSKLQEFEYSEEKQEPVSYTHLTLPTKRIV